MLRGEQDQIIIVILLTPALLRQKEMPLAATSATPFSQPISAQYLEGPRPMRVFHSGVVTASGPLLRAEPGFSELRRVCNKERRELY